MVYEGVGVFRLEKLEQGQHACLQVDEEDFVDDGVIDFLAQCYDLTKVDLVVG